MNVDVHIPSQLLTPFIKTYLIIESGDELVNRILPGTSLVMAFRYSGQVSDVADDIRTNLPSFAVSGLRKSGRLINYSTNTGNILVLFREAGARAFIKEPLHELFANSVPLDGLDGYQNLSIIEEQLTGARNNKERIDRLEEFLLSRLHNHHADPLIQTALERIHSAKGLLKIKDLADTLYISHDAFEKRFRRAIGASPKQFSYIIRMRAVVNGGLKSAFNSGSKRHPLTETAFDAGYFDQPHFNKDFKLFTGLTPTDFLKSPVFW
jgi:AraC-like DNA-binding protein